MKFSEFIPTYSNYTVLLRMLDNIQVTLIEAVAVEAEKIKNEFRLLKPTEKVLQEKYGFSKTNADVLMSIYNVSSIFITRKYLLFAERYKHIKSEADSKSGRLQRYKLTEGGESFLSNDLVALAEIDLSEMLLLILDDIGKFEESDDSSLDLAIEKIFTLYENCMSLDFVDSRVDNLHDRKLISKRYDESQDCTYYKISQKGKRYLKNFKSITKSNEILEKSLLIRNDMERLKMLKYLSSMDPYKFEHLICLLLKKMGYDNVEITSKGNDNGIDIKAEIKAGTSLVKEIIQVKRWNTNIQRPVIDQLRGVLSTSEEIKGSIFTTSDFSSGCRSSVKQDQSINLINGDQLINLLIDYGIGFKKKDFNLCVFSPDSIETR